MISVQTSILLSLSPAYPLYYDQCTNQHSVIPLSCISSSLSQIKNGLPAVLVYRKGELLGNLLRVTDHLGQEFTEGDVEGFLQE